MYGVTVSELWNGASGFSQVAIIAAIIAAIYVITKKSFFLYAAIIVFVLGIISMDTAQGNPINESIGALLCYCSFYSPNYLWFKWQNLECDCIYYWSIFNRSR